jgi:siroheme synthase (precorrin-2 oxidase/ferrochelatase)
MGTDSPEKPPAPDLPKYIREPLESSSPERLEVVATHAADLAEWKRRQRQEELERRRAEEEADEEQLEELEEREVSTDPADYDDVPASGA